MTIETGEDKLNCTLSKCFIVKLFLAGETVFELHATLGDTADHWQESRFSVPVVKEPTLLVFIPES